MKKLIIIGAGGFGREVLGYALDIPHSNREWELFGFIDDDVYALDRFNVEIPIVGRIEDHIVDKEFVYICAIGDTKTKLEICTRFKQNGAIFISLIHPTARIGRTSKYGQGLIMAPNSVVTENVTLGEFVIINGFSGVGHDAVIGSGCTLSSYCDVTGGVILEEGVFLGSHATIIPSKKIGSFARVGAGSVVLKNTQPNVVVFGNPAKIIF